VVLNLERMEHMLSEVLRIAHPQEIVEENTTLENTTTFMSMTAGSLAEAIIMKDVSLALLLASDRPMIALADAVSDLNRVVGAKKGESVVISNFLKIQTSMLSLEKIEAVLQALTSVLDGTHTDEKEAVQYAIEKAIAVLK
jgi:DUF438 domain-containing protein